jgi:hypothetical protein
MGGEGGAFGEQFWMSRLEEEKMTCKTLRFVTWIMAALMILAGSLAFAGGVKEVPNNAGSQAIVTELRDSRFKQPVVSIPMVGKGMVALADWVPHDPMVVHTVVNGEVSSKDVTIVPVAEIRMFVADIANKNQDIPFTEVYDFSAEKGVFRITFALPAMNQTVWFQDPAKNGNWYPVDALEGPGDHGYAFRDIKYDMARLLLDVTVVRWPAGDPTMGWGPK